MTSSLCGLASTSTRLNLLSMVEKQNRPNNGARTKANALDKKWWTTGQHGMGGKLGIRRGKSLRDSEARESLMRRFVNNQVVHKRKTSVLGSRRRRNEEQH